MTSTWVKICGTTNLEDAQMAVEAGADALGFIFAKSQRQIEPKKAAEIIAELPDSVSKVGVFQNQQIEFVERTAQYVRFSHIQLHGDEDGKYVEELFAKIRLPIIIADPIGRVQRFRKLLGIEGGVDIGPTAAIFAQLFDSEALGKSGGTGTTWDWSRDIDGFRELGAHVRTIVAGGLTTQNVKEAIHTLHPFGVDVVTGVEQSAGKKDPEKVKAFIRAVREADRAS